MADDKAAQAKGGKQQAEAPKGPKPLYKASIKSVRVSPRKARLVVDLIRGRPVVQALGILDNLPKKSSPVVKNLLKSAIANAEQKNASAADFDVDSLKVKVAYVDPGATLRRYRPRAMGRASPIRKRTSKITLMVG